jgi:hydroxyquinol 1,2-dioxygenase
MTHHPRKPNEERNQLIQRAQSKQSSTDKHLRSQQNSVTMLRRARKIASMSTHLTEQSITAAVQRTFDTSQDPRFRELFVALVQHLHDFVREIRLTNEEWFTAMDFLKRVGQISTPTRQEFVLLSDLLGLSELVDKVNIGSRGSATDSALLGPFYVEGRPKAVNGADISSGMSGTPMFVTGHVVDPTGVPVAGAHVDTWHSDGNGFYDVQQAEELRNHFAMRALLTTDRNGRFWYRSIAPRHYPIPTDGPCGEIMRAANRSVMRPQHIHFWIHANGYQPLITQLFLKDDPFINSDAVFSARDSLKVDFVPHEPGTAPDGTLVDKPFQTVEWTFVLAAAPTSADRSN